MLGINFFLLDKKALKCERTGFCWIHCGVCDAAIESGEENRSTEQDQRFVIVFLYLFHFLCKLENC